jgi:hypothetical protein
MSASVARVALHSRRSSSTLGAAVTGNVSKFQRRARQKQEQLRQMREPSREEIPLSQQFLSHFSPSSRVKCHVIRLISLGSRTAPA